MFASRRFDYSVLSRATGASSSPPFCGFLLGMMPYAQIDVSGTPWPDIPQPAPAGFKPELS
jgi:hypothetical protein